MTKVRHNPERRAFRGRSYKVGGRRRTVTVADLRERLSDAEFLSLLTFVGTVDE